MCLVFSLSSICTHIIILIMFIKARTSDWILLPIRFVFIKMNSQKKYKVEKPNWNGSISNYWWLEKFRSKWTKKITYNSYWRYNHLSFIVVFNNVYIYRQMFFSFLQLMTSIMYIQFRQTCAHHINFPFCIFAL
jgi:hypothetical protein